MCIACETVTDQKFITGAGVQNKLCWAGAWLRNKGMEDECPYEHAAYTATKSEFATFSESEMVKDIGCQ